MRRVAFHLLLGLVFAIPFEDAVLIPGLGTITRVLGLGAFGAWMLSMTRSRRFRRVVLFHYLVYAFVIWAVASVLWSADSSISAGKALTYIQLMTLVLLIWDLCESRDAIQRVLQFYVLGSWVTLGTIFQGFVRGGDQELFFRYSSAGADANLMAVSLALGLVIAWRLLLDSESRWMRLVNLCYLPAGLLGIALSGSRAGLVSASVAVIYLVSTSLTLNRARFGLLVLAVGLAVFSISTVLPEETGTRLLSTGDELNSGDLGGRAPLYGESVDAILDRPVFGGGVGTNRLMLPSGKMSHNVAFSIGVELGIVGIALMGAAIAVALGNAFTHGPRTRTMWLAVFMIWGIGATSLSIHSSKITWLFLALIVTSGSAQPIGGAGGRDARRFVGDAANPTSMMKS